VGTGDGAVIVRFRKEVEDPARDFSELGGEGAFGEREIMKGVGGLEVGGGQLGVMKPLVDRGQEFHGEFQPGFPGEDSVRGVERGGEGLSGAAEAVESNTGSVGVGDSVVVQGVGDGDGGGFGVADKVGAEVVEGSEFGGETGVGKGKVVVHGMDVAHNGRQRRRRQQCEEVKWVCGGMCARRDREYSSELPRDDGG